MPAPSHKYPVFLSSLCRELWDLRERIFRDVGKGTTVYVDEQLNPRRFPIPAPLEVTDELIARVREADLFICILGGTRHGSPIELSSRKTDVSFFEIELFQAALLRKKIQLFIRDDFAPEPKLQALLRTLQFAFPEWKTRQRQTDAQIIGDVSRLLDRYQSRRIIRALAIPSPMGKLVQTLYAFRARKLPAPSVVFLPILSTSG